jgi:hypothetical protein
MDDVCPGCNGEGGWLGLGGWRECPMCSVPLPDDVPDDELVDQD